MVYFFSVAFPFLFLAFLLSEPRSSELLFELGDGIVDRRNSDWKYRFYLPSEITETSSIVIDWRTLIVLLDAVIDRFTLTFHFVAKAFKGQGQQPGRRCLEEVQAMCADIFWFPSWTPRFQGPRPVQPQTILLTPCFIPGLKETRLYVTTEKFWKFWWAQA